MTAIAPIVRVDDLLKATTAAAAPTATTAPPVPHVELTQKFAALMQQPASEARGASVPGTNVVSNFIRNGQEAMDRLDAQSDHFREVAPTLSSPEMAATAMSISSQYAMETLSLQVLSSGSTEASKSLQTLIKNQ